jgi:hypothetical protein
MVCDQDRSRDHAGTNDDGCWNAHGAEYAPFGRADKPFERPYSDWTTTQNSASTTVTTPPTITVNGDNPAIIEVGDSYADLGATVTDTGPGQAGDSNLGYQTFLNGTLVSNIAIDTSQLATDTIDYVATDTDGLTATSTRTVLIEAPSIVPTDDASSTATTTSSATTTTQ